MDRQSLIDTAWENTENIVNCMMSEKSIGEFLHRDNPIVLRSTNMTRLEQDAHLNINLDTDGIVLGLRFLTAVKFKIRHFSFVDSNINRIKPVYNLLKKHLSLPKYNKNFAILKKSSGFQLFYENGWECFMTLLPTPEVKISLINDKELLEIYTSYFNLICTYWKLGLKKLALENQCMNTLQKNSLSSGNKLHILPDDQYEIFKCFDQGIIDCPTPNLFHAYVFLFRFGERSTGTFNLMKDFDMKLVKDQSIHIAATLKGTCGLGLLWSRQGLQNVVGTRGCLSTTLSFSDTANFQSNLDERLIDVSPLLRNLVVYPSKINFLQFYGDIPHVCPGVRLHPVSGSIVNCGILNGNTLKAIEKDAMQYISVIKDNMMLLKELKCRVEFVISPTEVISLVDPNSFFLLEHLYELLENEPIIVPFDPLEGSLCSALQEVGFYLINELEQCLTNGKRLGLYRDTWVAYQSELAIEKFIWGKPLDFKHGNLSVNLGPGLITPSRSKTDWLGFLSLDDSSATTVDVSPPPLNIWVSSSKVSSEISNLFGYYDFISSCDAVLGRRSMLIMLRDILELRKKNRNDTEFNNFLVNLKSFDIPHSYNCSGVINLTQLVQLLTHTKGVSSSMSTQRMYSMLKEKDKKVTDIMKAGLIELELKLFPAVKTYDANRHNTLTWNGVNVWKILPETLNTEIDDDYCLSFSQLIIQHLGMNNYVHWSKLTLLQQNAFVFPWVKPILRKMTNVKLKTAEKETILLFCSCVALLSNGWYVDYKKLVSLLENMPLTQFHLKGMEIQSTNLLGVISSPKIWRLHKSIPVKIDIPKRNPVPTVNLTDLNEKETSENNIEYVMKEPVLEMDDDNNVARIPMRHHSACSMKKWSADEIELLYRVKYDESLTTIKLKYNMYKSHCLSEDIPDRTFKAFSRRLSRI